mmetsp:Transcript_18986/g.46616  ORF Transcript_18986/g.46616 Transcript_18986/m.46616 type:complete len:643 (+) Transcript_18986:201-2129(+)|eukprot:CAMPEP_0114527340 /NCGR_PEP_ID=MMETSP0109-20121206/23560_1 /TAXON_ID=29199 /ORGANISM="Chlorarachnion reptans, Strain CCCM449" /LENGTH=642 /DNA_ID=CAMNT_0001709291 /DNA_START=125 /DNA_END=2053 /DNA_ORIENTATION=-
MAEEKGRQGFAVQRRKMSSDAESLSQQWEKMISGGSRQSTESSVIRELALQGIPTSIRPKVWTWLMGVEAKKNIYPGAFETACKGSPDDKTRYVIDSDIVRTFPSDRRFHKGQELYERLRRVLYAYATHDGVVKYTQGMNSVAAMLVMHVECDEDVFWMLDRICYHPDLHLSRLFGPGLKLVAEITYVLDRLLYRHFSNIHRSYDAVTRAMKLPTGVIGFIVPKLFFTLFTFLPIPVVCRIWDVMLAEGMIFLYRIGLLVVNLIHNSIPANRTVSASPFHKLMDGVHRVAKDPIFADPDKVIYRAKKLPPDEKEFVELAEKFQREEENRSKGGIRRFMVNNKSMLRVESFPSMRTFEEFDAKFRRPLKNGTKPPASPPLTGEEQPQQKPLFGTHTNSFSIPPYSPRADSPISGKSSSQSSPRSVRSAMSFSQTQPRTGTFRRKPPMGINNKNISRRRDSQTQQTKKPLIPRPASYTSTLHAAAMAHLSFAVEFLGSPRPPLSPALPTPSLKRSSSNNSTVPTVFRTSHTVIDSRRLEKRITGSLESERGTVSSSLSSEGTNPVTVGRLTPISSDTPNKPEISPLGSPLLPEEPPIIQYSRRSSGSTRRKRLNGLSNGRSGDGALTAKTNGTNGINSPVPVHL